MPAPRWYMRAVSVPLCLFASNLTLAKKNNEVGTSQSKIRHPFLCNIAGNSTEASSENNAPL